ncbi:MAG: HNH endonuclease signature motif containing protein [Rhodocyclaceae bacterium]|nr:HNH endonuclease signature motif containing protein [Rhodocyclaceae bacterium]
MTALSELKLLTLAQLEKAAIDSGFDVVGGLANSLMSFRSSQCPLKIWLGIMDTRPVIGLSMVNVAAELNRLSIPAPLAIEGCLAWTTAADFVDLDSVLGRAFALARALPNQLLESWNQQVQTLSATERESLVRQRVGQDLFRDGLMALWAGCCAITGLDEPALLRASHAKPWKDANDAERLDVYNGLLLAAHLDAAFDRGLITVDQGGYVIPSPGLSQMSLQVLGLTGDKPIVQLRSQHQPYMDWHREHVFRK